MELKTFVARDLAGNVIPAPTAHLYLPGTTTYATGLQTAAGAALSNPFTGTQNGEMTFQAPDGEYDLRVTGAGRDSTLPVQFFDASDQVALAQAAAQTATTQAAVATDKAQEAATTLTAVNAAASDIVEQATASATSAASSYATSAQTSAQNAALSSGATLWVSGTNYTLGQRVISPANNYVYRRKVAGAGTVDPSADAVNWEPDRPNLDFGLPKIRPSWVSDFSINLLDPRFGFTRASTGTYRDRTGILRTAAAGVPRFDHNPATGEALGVLFEPLATNLRTNSESFSFITGNCTSALSSVPAPLGTSFFTRITAKAGVANFQIRAYRGLTVGSSHNRSIFVKRETARYFFINADGSPFSIFDLLAGTVTSGAGAIQAIGPDLFRVSHPQDATIGGHNHFNGITNSTGNLSWGGSPSTGAESVLVWGEQITTSDLTSYIPTTTSQVTRAADSATISGAAFASWFNQSEGTVFVDFVPVNVAGDSGLVFSDGTNANIFRIFSRTEWQFNAVINGSETVVLDAGTTTPGQRMRLALTYNSAGFSLSMNGGAAVSAASAVPVVNQLSMVGNMTVRRAEYYPRRLSNAELQALTM